MSLDDRGMVPRPGDGAHHKRQLLKQQLHLQKRKTQEGKDRWEIVPIPEKQSFEKGFFLFIRAIQLLAQENEGVILVGLAGPSGAGKTAFSEKVTSFMPAISLISMDNYNVASRVIDGNFDDPRITDYDLLLENIASLKRGEPAEVPIYDFKTSSRVGFKTVPVPASRVVIIEGIYALSERLRPMMDLRVSITGGVHFDLLKRVLRDVDRSGQPPEEIITQISETVYPMYKAFIEPDLQTAHIKIVNKFNPFSGFQSATYILKAPKDGLLEETVRGALSPSHTENVEDTYDIYLLPPGEDKETCVSYLRMRNRDGRYSLMFEEWVTDGPFVITPRITYEVSVRLLGGLMALGYEMAHIIKRESRVFKDAEANITVKLDHLEHLNKDYVQVQGRERIKVREVAEKLGLEGKYVAKPYIEQIQLENLTKEVQAPQVPKDVLKERFRVSDQELTVSPGGGTLVTPRTSQGSSWRDRGGLLKSQSDANRRLGLGAISPSSFDPRGASPLSHMDSRHGKTMGLASTSSSRQTGADLSMVMERLDEISSRIDSLEARKPPSPTPWPTAAPPPTPAMPAPNSFASASALSNQISGAFATNGPIPNGHLSSPVSGVQSRGPASAVGSRSHSMNNGGGGMNNGSGGGGGGGASSQGLTNLDLTPQFGAREPSFDLARAAAGNSTSVLEFLEEVRMLARNQSRMADELESLNVMFRQTLERQVVGLYSGGGGAPGHAPGSSWSSSSWRLEAVISASAAVSLACASALLFTFLKSRGPQ